MKLNNAQKKLHLVSRGLSLQSLSLIKSHYKTSSLILLFDLLFFVVFLYVLPSLNNIISKSIYAPRQLQPGLPANAFLFAVILLQLAYYLFAVFIYSFFKYIVMGYVKSCFEKADSSFKRLGQFCILNIMIAGVFFAVMLAFNYILAGIRKDYQPFVFIALAVPYSLLLYIIANLAHSMFFQGASAFESAKRSMSTAFTKIRSYRETILAVIAASLALWILFLSAGYLLRLATSGNSIAYLSAYSQFQKVSVLVVDIVLYIVIFVNRVSFYTVVKDIK